jgi:hypothetical protein
MEWKMLVYFMVIRNISWPFGKIYGYLLHLVVIRYIFFPVARKIWQHWLKAVAKILDTKTSIAFYFFSPN